MSTFDGGLVEVGDGVHAYLQPDGSWGWSNAGLLVGDGASTLVDTLFDLRLTRQMLDTMEPLVARAPITDLVNTHANGDHCYGNQLLAGPGVKIHASAAAAREMDEVPPSVLAAMVQQTPPGTLGDFVRHAFGPFEFEGIEVPPVTDAFTGVATIDAGGRAVELIEVGPAHTGGDVIAWLPDARVVFTGDILFAGGTPVMWAGPIGNWIAACERIISLEPATVVPGHGPLSTVSEVAEMQSYLEHVDQGVQARHAAGMSMREAAIDLDAEINGTRYASWSDRERLVVTVNAAWRSLDPSAASADIVQLFTWMGEDYARHRPA